MRSGQPDEGAPGRPPNRSARRILKTLLDPEASAILDEIAIGPRTAAEIAESLGLEAAGVRRHLRRLLDTGEALRCGTARPGGRQENVYAADLRAGVLEPEELAGIPERMLEEADLAVLRTMHREAAAAAEQGICVRRPESALVRIPLPADDRGLRLATQIHRRLLERSLEEVERSHARLARSGEAPIAVSIQALFLECPPERWPLRVDVSGSRRSVELDRADRLNQSADSFTASIRENLLLSAASAAELAGRVGASVSQVRYELDRLLAEGLVRVAGTRGRRGTVERIFALDAAGHIVSAEEIARSRLRTEPAYGIWMVRTIFRQTIEALRTATSREAGVPFISRIPTAIDASGFANVSLLIEEATTGLADLYGRNLDSRLDGRPPDHLLLSALLLFEQARGGSARPWRVVEEG